MNGEMTSNRPYLLRALYEWIADNGLTPHILVEAGADGVDVPDQAVQKGKVILNIDNVAVRELDLGNASLSDDELVEFMIKHPILIERPIVLANGKAALGRPPEQVLKIL